jgi:hypothetical protein
MKIVGKALLYILMYLLLASWLDNSNNGTLYEMIFDANQTLYNLIPSEENEYGNEVFIKGIRYWLFYKNGANLISFAVVLIFFLGVDKKVWK